MKIATIIFISILALAGKCFGQQRMSTQLQNPTSGLKEKLWTENIIPIINKDTIKLAETINFPLQGEWGLKLISSIT